MEEKVPKESETIAAKREARLAEKISQARARIGFPAAWWTGKGQEAFVITVLFMLNLFLLSPFFAGADQATRFSAPIIPLIAKILTFFGFEYDGAIRVILTSFLAVFPLTFYFFIRTMTARKLPAFSAVIFASLPISPFLGERVQKAFVNGDGPHIASLSLVPLVLLGLLSFLRKGGLRNLVIAAGGVAAIGLISPFGFLIVGIFLAIETFSEMLLGRGRLKFIRAVLLVLVSVGLVSFWYNPGFVRLILVSPQGQDVVLTFSKLIPISLFAVPILGVLGFLLFERRPNLQPTFLASFFTIIFFLIVVVGGGVFPSHPTRYTAEFGIALAFLSGITILWLVDFVRLDRRLGARLKVSPRFQEILGNLVPVLLFLLFGVLSIARLSYLHELAEPQVLGIWEGIERGEIWMIRERADGIAQIFGYVITGVTVLGLSLLPWGSQRREVP